MRGEGIVDRFRRAPILVVLLALLVLAGVTTLAHSSNVAPKSSSIASAQNANSTALYCTGLSGTSGAEVGHLTFFNTTMFPRSLNVDIVSDKGLTSLSSFTLKSHTSTAIFPENLAKGDDFAAAVQVDGSGVIGEEVAAKSSAEAPCISAGVTQWFASGFDTTVGSTANLSIYNPTATPAVFNVSTYSPSGFSAPAPFQGMSVGAHDQMEINLGAQIVNTSNIGVHVNVLRGSIVIEGVQQSGSVVSFNSGQNNLVTTAWYPEVTTVNNAVAQIRCFNPSALSVTVVATVTIPDVAVAPQMLTLAPYASGDIPITPNSAIPPSGYANVELKSSGPVATSLLTGTSLGTSLWAPSEPDSEFIVADFSGKGFDAATVSNTSRQNLKVTFTSIPGPGQSKVSSSVDLAANTSESILSIFSGLSTLKAHTLLVTSNHPELLVNLTLPTTPSGIVVVSPLDGG
jgi:hypothetical protein